MFITTVPPVIISLLLGLSVKLFLDRRGGKCRITKLEFIVCSAALMLMTAPIVSIIGWNLSKTNLVTFTEYKNGWENAAVRQDITCYEDGSCHWVYDCNPYSVYVSATCYDSDDNAYECGGYETHYHQCPYVNVESTFTVGTTLGGYIIASSRFPDDPQNNRWDKYEKIPDSVVRRAGTGVPKFWSSVKERLVAGDPNPATSRSDYVNYILASDNTILKQRSQNIAYYNELGVLPPLSIEVKNLYDASKVHFVGYKPKDEKEWQDSLNRLNGAVGIHLQADVQIVVVNTPVVTEDPDTYTLALKAFWQDNGTFGKDTFSKNGIGIVIGTQDDITISWARSFTGMPLGNEEMLMALERSLKGKNLDPAVIVGSIEIESAVTKSNNRTALEIKGLGHSGLIPEVLYGSIDEVTRFKRVAMSEDGSGQGSGFLYLYSEISPTSEQKLTIAIVTFFFGLFYWMIASAIDMNEFRSFRRYTNSNYRR